MQKLTISQKSQTDSSLQNSTNAKYTPNYKNMQYSELLEKLTSACIIWSCLQPCYHACNHAIDEWYQFMVQCMNAQIL